MLSPSSTSRRTRPLPPLSCELAGSELPDVDDARHGDPRLPKVVGDLEPLVVGREDDCAVARLDRELADEPAHTAGEHHPDEVVPREDERLLGGSRGDDDPPGAEPVENGAGVDGNEPALPDPERTSRREHLDALELHSLQPGVLVDEHDARTPGRRSPCGRTAGLSTAHDEHACLPVLGVIAAGVPCVLVELPKAGGAPQELLVERPQSPRPDERAVVEADRGERAADLVGHGHEVEVERPADVLPLDDGALADRLGADANVRNAVDGHQAVRAVTRAAEQPSRSVVLERPGEDTLSGRERR